MIVVCINSWKCRWFSGNCVGDQPHGVVRVVGAEWVAARSTSHGEWEALAAI